MLDLHSSHPFFEFVRVEDSVPPPSRDRVDVAVLDMNHSWPNVGHDALVHAVLETAASFREELAGRGSKVRVVSYDVRRRHLLPNGHEGRFGIYIGTGGPGHIDPRLNDGEREWSQGIAETAEWEAPLFRLFDEILADESAAMLAICHSFGLVCRWSGIARPEMRPEKSSGMPLNRLALEAMNHPWFEQFSKQLADGHLFRVVDNRLFDLILDDAGRSLPIAFDAAGSSSLTMIELARDKDGTMPRVLGVNHHPEIIDREHIVQVLDEKREHGEVSEDWYQERKTTIHGLFRGENERQSRLTSHYTLLEPLRFHLGRVIRDRV